MRGWAECPPPGATSAACRAIRRAACCLRRRPPPQEDVDVCHGRRCDRRRQVTRMAEASDQLAAPPGLGLGDSAAVARDESRSVFGQVMGLVALTLGCL